MHVLKATGAQSHPGRSPCDHGLGTMPHICHATLPAISCHKVPHHICQPGHPGVDTVTEPCPGVPGRKGLFLWACTLSRLLCGLFSSPTLEDCPFQKKTPPCCPSPRGGRDSVPRPEGQGSHPGPRSAWPVGSPPGSPSAQGSPHSPVRREMPQEVPVTQRSPQIGFCLMNYFWF